MQRNDERLALAWALMVPVAFVHSFILVAVAPLGMPLPAWVLTAGALGVPALVAAGLTRDDARLHWTRGVAAVVACLAVVTGSRLLVNLQYPVASASVALVSGVVTAATGVWAAWMSVARRPAHGVRWAIGIAWASAGICFAAAFRWLGVSGLESAGLVLLAQSVISTVAALIGATVGDALVKPGRWGWSRPASGRERHE